MPMATCHGHEGFDSSLPPPSPNPNQSNPPKNNICPRSFRRLTPPCPSLRPFLPWSREHGAVNANPAPTGIPKRHACCQGQGSFKGTHPRPWKLPRACRQDQGNSIDTQPLGMQPIPRQPPWFGCQDMHVAKALWQHAHRAWPWLHALDLVACK